MDDRLLPAALNGDREALGVLLEEVRPMVHALALRYLADAEAARDATQEVLVKAITHLSSFEGNSRFATWVFRIATNHLLNLRRGERGTIISFDAMSAYLGSDPGPVAYGGPDAPLLAEEVKQQCSTAILQCLDRDQRMAYLLGEVFELSARDGAEVTGTTEGNHRKRLSLARGKVRGFMAGHCGLVDRANPCRCSKRIAAGLRDGRLVSGSPRMAHPDRVASTVEAVEELVTAADLFRQHPGAALMPAQKGLIALLLERAERRMQG